LPVLKRHATLLRFVNGKYYKGVESVLKGLEMALNKIVVVCYMTDSQHSDDSWGIGF